MNSVDVGMKSHKHLKWNLLKTFKNNLGYFDLMTIWPNTVAKVVGFIIMVIKDILAVVPVVIIVPVFPLSQPDPFKLNFLTLTF